MDDLIKKCYTNYKTFTSKKMNIMNYKKLVKEIREKLIIVQEELAALLGVSFASIYRWETGKHEPTTKIKRNMVFHQQIMPTLLGSAHDSSLSS